MKKGGGGGGARDEAAALRGGGGADPGRRQPLEVSVTSRGIDDMEGLLAAREPLVDERQHPGILPHDCERTRRYAVTHSARRARAASVVRVHSTLPLATEHGTVLEPGCADWWGPSSAPSRRVIGCASRQRRLCGKFRRKEPKVKDCRSAMLTPPLVEETTNRHMFLSRSHTRGRVPRGCGSCAETAPKPPE